MLSSAVHQRLAALDLPGNVFFGRVLNESVRRLSGGVAELDTLLGGGWPCGRLSELVGPLSSGKTSLLLTSLAMATRRGETIACVDVNDALHPDSLARAGAELERILWVRPERTCDAARCAELILQAGGFSMVTIDFGASAPRGLRAHVWPRLARAAERSHSALIIAAPYRVAGSFAVVSLSVRASSARWSPGLWPLFDGFHAGVVLARTKLGAPGGRITLRTGEATSPADQTRFFLRPR